MYAFFLFYFPPLSSICFVPSVAFPNGFLWFLVFLAFSKLTNATLYTGMERDGIYPPAPSTPPEPAPPDPSLGNSMSDPRSAMGSNAGPRSLADSSSSHFLQLQNSSTSSKGQQRLVKASTMPATGSHPSLEDMTCRKWNFRIYAYLVV